MDLVAAGAGADFDAFSVGLTGSTAAVGCKGRGGGEENGKEDENRLEEHG